MSKAWFFGDSLTFGTGCTPDESYYHEYKTPESKIFPEIITEHFEAAYFNHALPGLSTDSILISFYEKFKEFNSNDIVVIFRGFYDRIDIPNAKGEMRVLHQYGTNQKDTYNNSQFTENELKIISEFGIKFLMDNAVRQKRNDTAFEFIEDALDKLKIRNIIWSPADIHRDTDINKNQRLSIDKHTNGKINDFHFSYPGHIEFAKYLINKFELKYNTNRETIKL